MNDDQYLLASTYLDGELTAAERRLAEADPAVMTEVDRLSALRAQLRSVEPPSETARERAIDAAMATFAQAARPAPAINAVTRTVEFRRRPSYARYLGFAAAVVAVGVLGLVVANGLSTDGDDDSASFDAADVAIESPTDDAATDDNTAADADRAFTESAEAGSAEDAFDTVAPMEDMVAADDAQDAPTAEMDSGQPDASLAPAAPIIDPDQPLGSPAELGAYGGYLLELRADGSLPPTPNTACSQAGVLGLTQYVFDELPIDVLVAVDERDRTVTAINPDTCEPLVVGPLF